MRVCVFPRSKRPATARRIAEVYEAALDGTNTFNGAVGRDLAYLLGAMAKGGVCQFSRRCALVRILSANVAAWRIAAPFVEFTHEP